MENLDTYLNYLYESKLHGPDPADIAIYKIRGKFLLNVRTKLGKRLTPWAMVLFRNNQFDLFQKGNDVDHVLLVTSLLSNMDLTPKLNRVVPIIDGEATLKLNPSLSGSEFYITDIKGIPFLENKNVMIKVKLKSARNWLLAGPIFNMEGTIKYMKQE